MNKDWRIKYLEKRDDVDSLKRDLLDCYRALSVIAIDSTVPAVERDFISDIAKSALPYDAEDMLSDLRKMEVHLWKKQT
jgi:hypothetical protein